jgi:hypothetical protein
MSDRYDVAIMQGNVAEIHRDQSWGQRNRWVDFGFRHGFRVVVTEHHSRTRGEGTYR